WCRVKARAPLITDIEGSRLQNETRNPNDEIRKKPEARNPNFAGSPDLFRASGFGFLSGFGFRHSDLPNLTMPNQNEFNLFCPIPIAQYPHVLMAHGGGGKLMHQLIGKMFLTAFNNPLLQTQRDSTVVELPGRKIAFTTDSYVVRPIFFPGGDIGSMAVHGTVNDLAMSGARPLYLSSAFIIEEGLRME